MKSLLRFGIKIFQVILLMILPFWVLVRGALWIHTEYQISAWLSLGLMIMTVAVILLVYMSFFWSRLRGKLGGFKILRYRLFFSLFLVLSFTLYAIFYVSASNVKSAELRQEFKQLHPILRVSLSTIIVFDRKTILTDVSRSLEDYDRMGIQRNLSSKHLKQPDGYVHAIDIRTKGRAEWRNLMIVVSFRSLGFRAIRQVGTADHLHISLP